MSHSSPAPDATDSSRSVGELVADIARDLQKLVRQEIELAKTEIRAEVARAGKGAGMLGGAGVAGHLLLVFVSLALMFALDALMPIGWAALLVGVLWGVVAAILASTGRKQLKAVNPSLPATTQTIKEDVQWAKHPTSAN